MTSMCRNRSRVRESGDSTSTTVGITCFPGLGRRGTDASMSTRVHQQDAAGEDAWKDFVGVEREPRITALEHRPMA